MRIISQEFRQMLKKSDVFALFSKSRRPDHSKLNKDVVESVQKVSTEMTSSVKTVNESLAGVVANMNESTQKLGELVGASVSSAFNPINENIGALSKSVEAIPAISS